MAEKKKKPVWRWVILGSGLLFVVWLFNAPTDALEKARRTEGLVMASSLTSAVNFFHEEYDCLPDVGVGQVRTDTPEGKKLLAILLGLEVNETELQNERQIVFLQWQEARNGKGGMVYGTGETVEGAFDPYGNPYTVVLNSKDEDTLVFQFGGKTIELRGKQVAVWSVGKDGKEGTKDDVRSWN